MRDLHLDNPLLSVVVPNLNEELYLPKFLVSLTWQHFKDFEVIIIDGGSTDSSLKICKQFESKLKLKVIINKTPNIGYIRNVGAAAANGILLFHTSSDVMLDPWLLDEVVFKFMRNHSLVAFTGRTHPISDKILCHVAYQGFDLLRWLFTHLPKPLRKYRPGGNFFAIHKNIFNKINGFPNVPINEDGLLGQKIDALLSSPLYYWAKVDFDLKFYVHHHVKRFEERGSVKTILFYLYVLANLFPILKRFLYKVEAHSGEVFKNRSDLRDFSGRS